MKKPKAAENIPSYYQGANGQDINTLLEQFNLHYYRWQAILYLVRAGKKEGTSELDDLNAALSYLNRDLARVQKRQSVATPRKPRKKAATPEPTATQLQPEAVSA